MRIFVHLIVSCTLKDYKYSHPHVQEFDICRSIPLGIETI